MADFGQVQCHPRLVPGNLPPTKRLLCVSLSKSCLKNPLLARCAGSQGHWVELFQACKRRVTAATKPVQKEPISNNLRSYWAGKQWKWPLEVIQVPVAKLRHTDFSPVALPAFDDFQCRKVYSGRLFAFVSWCFEDEHNQSGQPLRRNVIFNTAGWDASGHIHGMLLKPGDHIGLS